MPIRQGVALGCPLLPVSVAWLPAASAKDAPAQGRVSECKKIFWLRKKFFCRPLRGAAAGAGCHIATTGSKRGSRAFSPLLFGEGAVFVAFVFFASASRGTARNSLAPFRGGWNSPCLCGALARRSPSPAFGGARSAALWQQPATKKPRLQAWACSGCTMLPDAHVTASQFFCISMEKVNASRAKIKKV